MLNQIILATLNKHYCVSGRIVRAREKPFKIMWIIGVVGLGLLCSYFTASLTNEYMSFPKVGTCSQKRVNTIKILRGKVRKYEFLMTEQTSIFPDL